MELDGLPRGQPQRAVAALARHAVSIASHCAGVSTPPGTRSRAMKMKAFSSFLRPRSGTQVAVVLLVDAVELGQLLVVLGQPAG